MTVSNGFKESLSNFLPPLIFGTATFNYQFNLDPYAINPNTIVSKALESGIRAFDTSPYYGPAEEILGTALSTPAVRQNPAYSRENYYLLTKVGRIAGNAFDYSPEWIRHSIKRSCRRLNTSYLDVVYCHDVEFVSKEETLNAIKELRRIRDEEKSINYVGICGYPVSYLCELAEYIVHETGEPLDIVQSYANFTLQNQRLLTDGLERFVKAGVDVVPNASPLGMGLLRSQGVPVGGMGNWHPAPDGLREACARAASWVDKTHGERLETVAIRFAMETWLKEGTKVGTKGKLPGSAVSDAIGNAVLNGHHHSLYSESKGQRLGVSVMGVSAISELISTMRIWRSVIDGLSDPESDYFSATSTSLLGSNLQATGAAAAAAGSLTPGSDTITDHEWSLTRRQHIRQLALHIRDIIGTEWTDFAWHSPEPGFVNQRTKFGVTDDDEGEMAVEKGSADQQSRAEDELVASCAALVDPDNSKTVVDAAMLTPPSEPELMEQAEDEIRNMPELRS